MSKKVSVNVSFGMMPVVAVLAVLKVAGVLNVSWWWVFFPLFLPICFVGIAFLVMGLAAALIVTAQRLARINIPRLKYLAKERVKKWLKMRSNSR